MTAAPPPPGPDWVAGPPAPGSYGGWGWAPGLPGAPLPPAGPPSRGRLRVPLIAALSALVGAVVAAALVSALFLAGARETGTAMADRISDRLGEQLGLAEGSYPGLRPGPGASGPVAQSEPVAPGVLGPDPVLEAYAQQCFAGDLQSCDDLFYGSAPGSDYEEYGTSCGRRVEPGAVSSCTELD